MNLANALILASFNVIRFLWLPIVYYIACPVILEKTLYFRNIFFCFASSFLVGMFVPIGRSISFSVDGVTRRLFFAHIVQMFHFAVGKS